MNKSAAVIHVANLPGRRAWCGDPILGFMAAKLTVEQRAIPMMAAQSHYFFSASPIRDILALHAGHMLGRPVPDWGIMLTEPQATKGLAHLVQGRERRIRGLLKGLGIAATDDEIRMATVEAETSERIDLLIRLGARAFIIEAKFGHKVTKGQLARYSKALRGRKRAKGDCDILLLIDPANAPDLHHKQRQRWRSSSWVELLLGFERELANAPSESDDDDFRLFRRLIWHRIGGLSMRRH